MSDLFETLELVVADLDAQPLPAAVVRRRGDRLRRQRLAAQVLVATTVVAIVAWVVAVLLADRSSAGAEGPPGTSPQTATIGGSTA